MESDELVKTLKLAVIASFIIAFAVAIFYSYGFFFIWQGVIWGIMTTFLVLFVFLLIVLVFYLWIKTIWLKRTLEKYKSKNNEMKIEE